jgi:hypothetical protein
MTITWPWQIAAGIGVIGMIERRHEPRIEVNLTLSVWGIDTKGDKFLQQARTCDISRSGALLSEFDVEVGSGDLVGVLYAGKKARFTVAWVRYSGGDRMAAIHRVVEDECPWENLLPKSTQHSVLSTQP